MKITRLASACVTQQYSASDALVLPVEAQAARLAPIVRACVNAAVMPLSLKLPEGFIPSYCRNSWPAFRADVLGHAVGREQQRLPFADRDDLVRGANGSSSWNRHTPLRQSGSFRRAHFCSNHCNDLAAAAVPVVGHVQQRPASVAGRADLAHVERGPATRASSRYAKSVFVCARVAIRRS